MVQPLQADRLIGGRWFPVNRKVYQWEVEMFCKLQTLRSDGTRWRLLKGNVPFRREVCPFLKCVPWKTFPTRLSGSRKDFSLYM
jgi:hypothetical protein